MSNIAPMSPVRGNYHRPQDTQSQCFMSTTKKKRHHRQKKHTHRHTNSPNPAQMTSKNAMWINLHPHGYKTTAPPYVSPTSKTRTSKWKVFRGKNCCHLTLALGHPNEPAAQNKPYVLFTQPLLSCAKSRGVLCPELCWQRQWNATNILRSHIKAPHTQGHGGGARNFCGPKFNPQNRPIPESRPHKTAPQNR